MFDTVLVANRGEIAVRVIRTLRRLGIRSVAVHSDADADARHVREADTAVRLGPAPARESYLDIDAVVDAARRTGAQAVHPGYGFLSENADFARALDAAGIVFVGPPVGSLDAMADKIRAKETVAAYDVPVVPGIQDPTLTDEQITAEAERVGFPLLIKPSAGGGGKGMVAVRAAEELPGALASARRTARSAFGDDTLLLERLITAPRHIEVQVFADAHGATVHLGERECSLQRRHQKVIEEAPAPLLTGLAHGAELRERLGRAAVDAAVSVGYRGAGTVEFLVSDENPDEFFFMEMNTRLQVEHPVSEEVVRVRGQRLDFVELQLRIAAGEPLGFAQEDVSLDGAAVEARVYAEDPANGFLPSTGPVLRWREPAGEGVRVDTLLLPSRPAEERAFGSVLTIRDDDGALWEGLAAPDSAQPEITGFYDPMIAKLIARGADRAEALAHAEACFAAGGTVVIEDFLDGPEVSLFVICDGEDAVALTPAQDFKRIHDGDAGPNTGGMGAYTPLPWLPEGFTDEVMDRVARPVLAEMARRGTPFTGVLFCGLAVTAKGVEVIEFNVRFGDPETQAVLARLETPLGGLLADAAAGRLGADRRLEWSDDVAVDVVMASAGYPASSSTGDVISGLADAAALEGVHVIHAGTAASGEDVVTAGGRVLAVVGRGADLAQARERAYAGVERIRFDGAQWRTDIGLKAERGEITVPGTEGAK
nr:biotin carboxylase N-terminal domain-containing protein [Micrococcus luteus]